jgi:hypothetical protein
MAQMARDKELLAEARPDQNTQHGNTQHGNTQHENDDD